jgi:type II secretory pathway component PulC
MCEKTRYGNSSGDLGLATPPRKAHARRREQYPAQVSRRSMPRRQTAVRQSSNLTDLEERLRRLTENRFSLPKKDAREAARNSAAPLSQVRILPRWEEGQVVGVQLNAIEPGSVFEQIGIRAGDTVAEFNGTRIGSLAHSAELMRQFGETDEISLVVEGLEGEERTLTHTFE